MASTLTRLAGMQDVPAADHDPEAQSIYNVTARPTRASIPIGRRLSRRSLTSLKSTKSIVTSPADDADVPPLPSGPAHSGGGYSATKSSLQQQGNTWAGHSARQEQSQTLLSNTLQQQQQQQSGDQTDAGVDDDEIPWGPAHPCFPHPNPHAPLGSAEREATRVIRVQRDWLVSGDAYPQLQNVYPEILAEWLSEEDFRTLVEGINARLEEAFAPNTARAVLDAVLGVATGFVSDDLGFTGVKRGVAALETWMATWNEAQRRDGNEIRLVPLRRTGFMNLDLMVPDPQIDVVGDEEGGESIVVGLEADRANGDITKGEFEAPQA